MEVGAGAGGDDFGQRASIAQFIGGQIQLRSTTSDFLRLFLHVSGIENGISVWTVTTILHSPLNQNLCENCSSLGDRFAPAKICNFFMALCVALCLYVTSTSSCTCLLRICLAPKEVE